MIRFSSKEENISDEESKGENTAKFIFSDDLTLEGTTKLIPVDCGSKLISHSTPASELGKQLLVAAEEGNVEEAKNLLSQGALFAADWLGTSPLHKAAANNHLEICKILLKAGISRDARTKVDKTPLHVAATRGHVEIVEVLLEHGADPDARDMLRMTPLHWAVQNGHIEVAKLLIKHFAQIDCVNKFKLTPRDIAAQINRQDIIDLLLMGHRNSSQQLKLELLENSNESSIHTLEQMNSPLSSTSIPFVETILMEDTDGSNEPEEPIEIDNIESMQISEDILQNQNNSYAESLRYLQEQGITMLPNDDNNILSTVMESGHSVVLTDVGKQMLNSVKESEERASNRISSKRIFRITPEEFLAMTTDPKNTNILRQVNRTVVPRTVKRIIMKKNKMFPVSTTVNNVIKTDKPAVTDVETIKTQLIKAYQTIALYKKRLILQKQETEKYKQKLRLLITKTS